MASNTLSNSTSFLKSNSTYPYLNLHHTSLSLKTLSGLISFYLLLPTLFLYLHISIFFYPYTLFNPPLERWSQTTFGKRVKDKQQPLERCSQTTFGKRVKDKQQPLERWSQTTFGKKGKDKQQPLKRWSQTTFGKRVKDKQQPLER